MAYLKAMAVAGHNTKPTPDNGQDAAHREARPRSWFLLGAWLWLPVLMLITLGLVFASWSVTPLVLGTFQDSSASTDLLLRARNAPPSELSLKDELELERSLLQAQTDRQVTALSKLWDARLQVVATIAQLVGALVLMGGVYFTL